MPESTPAQPSQSDSYEAEARWRQQVMGEVKDALLSGDAPAAYQALTRHERAGYPWAPGAISNQGPDAARAAASGSPCEDEYTAYLADQVQWGSYFTAWMAGYIAGRDHHDEKLDTTTLTRLARADYEAHRKREGSLVVIDAIDQNPVRDTPTLLAAAKVLAEQIGLKDPDWDAIARAQEVVDACL